MSLQNKWMSGIKSGGEEIMDRWFSPFTQNVRKVWNSRMDRILDVGCGEGTHVGHLLSRMRRGVVTGIDDNPSCVLKAIENNKKAVVDGRCRIIMGSLEKLPFASDSFDLVTLASEKADIRNPQIVKEAYRVLDEDGTIVLSWPWKRLHRMRKRNRWYRHREFWKMPDLLMLPYAVTGNGSVSPAESRFGVDTVQRCSIFPDLSRRISACWPLLWG